MRNVSQAIWVELLKVRRSRMPLLTALAFSLAPLAGGFFMIVLKDPAAAQRLGIVSGKAQLMAGSADWVTYLGILAQAVGIGGNILFAFVATYIFGREFAEQTVKDLLALPTPRSSIVFAKFVLVGAWCFVLTVWIYVLGVLVGTLVGLAPVPSDVIWQGTLTYLVVALLTILLATPIAFFASVGRGYLTPMAAAILFVVMAQVIAAAGWGEYFPWAVPALYSGVAGPDYGALGAISFILVGIISFAGLAATFVWWDRADQSQ